MKKLHCGSILITFVSFVVVLLYFSPACAVEAKLSGQVNQLIMWADNGVDNDIFIGDNENSSTRLRFTGSEEFNGVTAGIRIEFDAERNLSANFDLPNRGDGSGCLTVGLMRPSQAPSVNSASVRAAAQPTTQPRWIFPEQQ